MNKKELEENLLDIAVMTALAVLLGIYLYSF